MSLGNVSLATGLIKPLAVGLCLCVHVYVCVRVCMCVCFCAPVLTGTDNVYWLCACVNAGVHCHRNS